MSHCEYIVYDTMDYDRPMIIGKIEEVAAYLGMTPGSVRSGISRGLKALRRYEVVRVEDEK